MVVRPLLKTVCLPSIWLYFSSNGEKTKFVNVSQRRDLWISIWLCLQPHHTIISNHHSQAALCRSKHLAQHATTSMLQTQCIYNLYIATHLQYIHQTWWSLGTLMFCRFHRLQLLRKKNWGMAALYKTQFWILNEKKKNVLFVLQFATEFGGYVRLRVVLIRLQYVRRCTELVDANFEKFCIQNLFLRETQLFTPGISFMAYT